ncbi:glutathione S-transferase T3-like [Salvia splendens]|uniref:glutathione S-transferase T3-like n=1 Tax=Salvia splendens TaxID=180675 RepID=UPI001C25EEC3|nr:glutathione S-transferase T3-like [Salvia splendens]
MRSSQTHGLSQIREDIPEAVLDGEDGDYHPYTQAETMALFDAWISLSNDPILGNQQNRKVFWDKVTVVYNANKPRGAFRRNLKMLRAHFERADRDVKRFCGIYKREAEQYQSGASGSNIMRAALRIFKSDTDNDFKFPDVWEAVKHLDR